MSTKVVFFAALIIALLAASCGPATPAPQATEPPVVEEPTAAPEAEPTEAQAEEPTEPAASGEKVTLSFWTEFSAEPEKSVTDELVRQFNETHPNIKVEHRSIENEQFFTVLRTGFTSGEPPDVFQHEGHNNLYQFVIPGEVEDISDWWAEKGDRFQPGTEASITYQGKQYGIPWTLHTDTQIYYNETVLEENGIDPDSLNTWDDYLAAFETLKSNGVTPISFANKFGWSGSQWFFAFLARWVGTEKVLDLAARNCDYKWTDPDIVEAAKLYTDLNDAGYFSMGKASDDFPAATALFFAGKTGFFQTGSWFLGDAEANAPPDFKLGMKTFPMIEGGQGDPDEVVMQGLEGISISKKGAEKNREATLLFMEWLSDIPQAQTWVKEGVKISPVKGAVTAETASPFLQQIVEEQIDGNTGSFPFLEHVVPKTVGEEAIWMGSVGVLTGQLDAESWMQNVEDEAAGQDPTLEREPTSCGAPPEETAAPAEAEETGYTGEKVTLSFWTEFSAEPEKSVTDELVRQFNETHPNIKVEHRSIENEQFFTVLRTGFTSGEPPDVFQHEGHNNLYQFVIPGEVEDISDWWAEKGDRFQPGTEASITYQGKQYGIPWTLHTDTQIYYNETVLEENGIDPDSLNTWDDYLAAFETLKSNGVTPISFANKFGWSGSQWFFAFLARWVGTEKVLDLAARNCDYKWTDPDIVEAAKLYTDLNDAGYFSMGKASDDFPAATALFFAGKTGFFQTGSWFLGDAEANAPPDFKLGMKTFPMIEGGQGDPDEVVMQGLEGISISKKGAEKNREATLLFMEWLSDIPQAQTWVKEGVKISPVKGAVTAETASPFLQQIVEEQIDGNTGSFPFLEHVVPKTVGEEAIWMGSVGVLTGQLDAESWMQNVEDEAAGQDPTLEREPVSCQ